MKTRVAFVAMAASTLLLAACGTTTTTAQPKGPIRIGVSLSISGDFSGDGKAILQGYKLWAHDVNANGGLLGRKVELVVKNDGSSTQQTITNYNTLIGTNKVDLVFGPFSSLLTIPAEQVAKRFGYVLLGPAGGAPNVFAEKYKGYAFVQPASVVNNLLSFAGLIKALPASQRPATAAYATSNDPFTQPQLPPLEAQLTQYGVKTVSTQVFPDETPDLQPEALKIVRSGAQVVVLGTTSVPQVQAFVNTFIQQHYNPKVIIATAGPDQGAQFSKAIGVANTEAFLVPSAWTSSANTYQNAKFVQEYLAQYGGTANAIPQDAPEAYSVGQIMAQMIEKTHSIDNATLIKALHDTTFKTVQGPMSFGPYGAPVGSGTFLVQWQGGNTKIVWPQSIAQTSFEFPKPNWH